MAYSLLQPTYQWIILIKRIPSGHQREIIERSDVYRLFEVLVFPLLPCFEMRNINRGTLGKIIGDFGFEVYTEDGRELFAK